ncbi:MAG: RNA methyltransferase [Pseudomonadota bacterium]
MTDTPSRQPRAKPSQNRTPAPGRHKRPHPNARKGRTRAPVPGLGPNQVRLYGHHAVKAALANPHRTIAALRTTETLRDEFSALLTAREGTGDVPPVYIADQDDLARVAGAGAVHQGVVLECDLLPEPDFAALLDRVTEGTQRGVMILDHVTDPHNVGAIIRSCAAFGVDDLIMTHRYAPPLAGTLAKAASGGLEQVRVHQVVNLADALDELRDAGAAVLGLDERGDVALPQAIGQAGPGTVSALVMGAEDKGLRPKTRLHCAHLVRLEAAGGLTLNVSAAAAVSLHVMVAGHTVPAATGWSS